MEITGVYAGKLVKEWQNKTGSVSLHSMFKHSFNLTDGHSLLHVGMLENNIVPFGLHVSQYHFHLLQHAIKKDQVKMKVSHGKLTIGSMVISLEQVKYYDPLKIEWQPFCSSTDTRFVCHLASTFNGKTGLDFTKELAGNAPYFDYCCSDKKEEVTRYFIHYIGRGLGLTPSGDDFTVGLLAVHHVSPFLSTVFLKGLADYLKEDVTTDVSKAYINAALSGYFSLQVDQVMTAFAYEEPERLHQAVRQLGEMGHTSGYDTLMGIVLGLQQVVRQNVIEGV